MERIVGELSEKEKRDRQERTKKVLAKEFLNIASELIFDKSFEDCNGTEKSEVKGILRTAIGDQ